MASIVNLISFMANKLCKHDDDVTAFCMLTFSSTNRELVNVQSTFSKYGVQPSSEVTVARGCSL